MNERIKQLAEQAYLYQEHDTCLIAALENFAELIVKECINACGSDFGTQLIKQHFGITE